MKKIVGLLAGLPIKWKLTLWSSLVLFLLFTVYNSVQYLFIDQWMLKQEQKSELQTVKEIQSYFSSKKLLAGPDGIAQSRAFLKEINHQHQAIRVLDADGQPILAVYDRIPDNWVAPVPVLTTEVANMWHGDDHLMIVRSPLRVEGFTGTVELVNNLESVDKLKDVIFLVMIVGGLGAVLLSGLGGRLLAGRLLKPIHSMAQTMSNIKRKGWHERMQPKNNHDEITALMIIFNDMMDQVETSFQQQKQFVEDASHELRTPVAIIEGHLAMLRRWGKNDPAVLEESLDASIQELTRLKGLVQELLALTRAERAGSGAGTGVTRLDQAIRQLVRNAAVLHPSFHFEAEVDALGTAEIAVDAQHLDQILLIVLDNAVKYSSDSPTVRITGNVRGGAAIIHVIDYGIGIPAADLPYVMDRFYRADKARNREMGGHGLGLSIAKRLVERYAGTISIHSVQNEGTQVTIAFPLMAAAQG